TTRLVRRRGVRVGRRGTVVVVPGTLGSALIDGAGRHLWLVPPRLDELLLDPDGAGEAAAGRTVRPTDVNILYAPLIHALEPFWEVLPFAYDWRKGIPESARLLAEAARGRFGDAGFHLVTHSMGGLVARVMLAANPDLQNGGKLIMLATPNHGSVLAVEALTSDLGAAAFFRAFGLAVPPAPALAAFGRAAPPAPPWPRRGRGRVPTSSCLVRRKTRRPGPFTTSRRPGCRRNTWRRQPSSTPTWMRCW